MSGTDKRKFPYISSIFSEYNGAVFLIILTRTLLKKDSIGYNSFWIDNNLKMFNFERGTKNEKVCL